MFSFQRTQKSSYTMAWFWVLWQKKTQICWENAIVCRHYLGCCTQNNVSFRILVVKAWRRGCFLKAFDKPLYLSTNTPTALGFLGNVSHLQTELALRHSCKKVPIVYFIIGFYNTSYSSNFCLILYYLLVHWT